MKNDQRCQHNVFMGYYPCKKKAKWVVRTPWFTDHKRFEEHFYCGIHYKCHMTAVEML